MILISIFIIIQNIIYIGIDIIKSISKIIINIIILLAAITQHINNIISQVNCCLDREIIKLDCFRKAIHYNNNTNQSYSFQDIHKRYIKNINNNILYPKELELELQRYQTPKKVNNNNKSNKSTKRVRYRRPISQIIPGNILSDKPIKKSPSLLEYYNNIC